MEKRSVDCLIFSKDRPAQLDVLLRTVDLHAHDLYRTVTALTCWSDTPYLNGYALLARRHPYVRWWSQGTAFQRDVEDWLGGLGGFYNREYVSFLCDDDVFVADVDVHDIELPWSLRAGDYDYPFSLDGNIYRHADVQALLDGLSYRNPTQLEHQGFLHRGRLPFGWVRHNRTCLVGVPLNRVSDDSTMPHLGVHEYDLNERFLRGECLSLTLPPPDEIVTPHVSPLLVEWEAAEPIGWERTVPHGEV